MKKIITTMTMLALTATFAQPPGGGQGGQRGPGSGQPPKEAIAACKNKDEGASCSFKSPRGDSPEGTCKKDGEYLACMPSGHPREK